MANTSMETPAVMISSPGFPGANVPISVLQTKLQQVSEEIQRGDLDPEMCRVTSDIYGSSSTPAGKHWTNQVHADLCSLVDRLAPGKDTIGTLTQACQAETNSLAVRYARFDSHRPMFRFGIFGGGWLALAGLGHVILTDGAWRLGGAAGLAAGGAAAACCAWLEHRAENGAKTHDLREKEEDYLERWAKVLDSPASQSPSTCPVDIHAEPSLPTHQDLPREEKEELIAQLRLEIQEAEQKTAAKIERKGSVVNIGGVNVAVNNPTGKEE